MKFLKSFAAMLAVAIGVSAAMSPAYAIYNPYGDIVAIIFYPDGTVVV